jgi:hypothetical protein
VKKFVAIFLLSIYLLSSTAMSELLKVNVLVEHFQETRMKNGPVAFFDFLVMHYITDDGNSLDDDRDCQLPFKSHSSLVANNFSNFILNRYVEIVLTPVKTDERHFYNYCSPYISSNFSKLVWNPPKIS